MEDKNGSAGGDAPTIILDAPVKAEPEAKPTTKDAEESGLTAQEVEAGKKHGIFTDVDPKKNGDGKDKDEDGKGDDKDKNQIGDKGKKTDDKTKDQRREIKPWEKDVPEEDKAAMKEWTPNEKAHYWKHKKEKWRRQEEEGRRRKAELEASYWKGKAEEAAKRPPATPEALGNGKDQGKEDEDFLDENYGKKPGKEGDDDKPLTKADLDRIEKEKDEKARKAQEAVEERKKAAMQTLNQQEADFREDHPDFETTFDFTLKVINADAKELEQLFPNAVERRGVKSMVQEWLMMLREPEKHTGEESAVSLAYEIGKLHPEFKPSNAGDGEEDDAGKQGDEDSEDDDEGDDDDADAKSLEKRLDKQGRHSSAPLSGGANRRPVSIKDLTQKDLAEMPRKQFDYLWKNHRKEIERILNENG